MFKSLLLQASVSSKPNLFLNDRDPFPKIFKGLKSNTREQESANFSGKRPDSKCFRLWGGVWSLSQYSTLRLQHEGGHRERGNEQAWLCSNKALFMDSEIEFHIISCVMKDSAFVFFQPSKNYKNHP